MKIFFMVVLVAWVAVVAGVKGDSKTDLPQHTDVRRGNSTLLTQRSEGLRNNVKSEVNKAKKSRKIKTGFFESSMTNPIFNAMKSTFKLFQNPFKRKLKRKVAQRSQTKSTQKIKANDKNRFVQKRPTYSKRVIKKSKLPPKPTKIQTKPVKTIHPFNKHGAAKLGST